MKSFFYFLIIFISIYYSKCFSQSGWIKSYVCQYIVSDIHFLNQNTGYSVGNNQLYKTTNKGITWSLISNYTNESPASGFYFDENNYVLIGSTQNHIYGWVGIINNGIRTDYYFFPTYGSIGFASTDWLNRDTGFVAGFDLGAGGPLAKAYRTFNRGVNWVEITPVSCSYINCIKIVDKNLIFAVGSSLQKTTNMGNNWIYVSDTLGGYDFCCPTIDTFYISANNGRVLISTNGGINWNYRNVGINFGVNRVQFFNSKTGWICGSGGYIMKTTNAGINWQTQLTATNITLRDLFILNENYIWAVGDSAYTIGIVFRTTTGGASFVSNSGIEIINNHKLYQNYPNPFNPITNIKYQITKNNFVTLKIYDILGKEIETLVNERQSPGMYEVHWNGEEYPSGVYFYKITAGDFTETRKMILMK
jgi:hypothetical protein